MKKYGPLVSGIAMAVLILDSRCGAESAAGAVELCLKTLIPVLFPLFVLGAMVVPGLSRLRIPVLASLLGIPEGSEGMVLLGCGGGFPVGAACLAQAVRAGAMEKRDAQRMLGIVSFCGPSFLFGVIGRLFSPREAALLFCIQLETAVLVAMVWPSPARSRFRGDGMAPVSLTEAIKRATGSMAAVCGWVMLAGVLTGFLRKWLFILPEGLQAVLSGALELTNGVFSLEAIPAGPLRLMVCAGFVCFGGVSVLLQIGGLASSAGLSIATCIAQKVCQGLLAVPLTWLVLQFGPGVLLFGLAIPAGKIAVEIFGTMVYNVRRKEGI